MGVEIERDGGQIQVLTEHVRNQIAAGEVVERPASVVKELVENALDAGASHIEVDLEEGGARLVRVTDNGSGMGEGDVGRAFLPHATSKLRLPEDLVHIASLGFRGEALASIGSVSRAALQSRTSAAELGWRVENEGGRIGALVEKGCPAGTCVEVRDLFYNTPARRRFLKRTSTEFARCLDVVQRLALAHEGVGFVMTHDGKRVLDVEPEMDLRARVRRAFGAELADALVAVEASHEAAHVRLEGFVAPPRFARRDTGRQMWFLNGRYLRDKVLMRCLREGYRGFLIEGRQPTAFLHLHMDPSAVDVNVSPTKAEVRFREQRQLFGFCVNALREAVAKTDIATPGESMLRTRDRRLMREDPNQARFSEPGVLRPIPPPVTARDVPGADYEPGERIAAPASTADTPRPDACATDGVMGAAGDDLGGPYLQVARTYLLRALPEGFEIIDQHALHERITLEDLRAEVLKGRPQIQRLLVPELVDVSKSELERLKPRLEEFAKIGIELEPFGEATVAVHGLPARLKQPDAAGLVRDLIGLLEEKGETPRLDELIEEVLHRCACRSSVMAGDALSEDEIRALLERGQALESDQTCPHARPTRVRFSLEDLEKAFHRR
jgi:DNA mismatch repair protein MutL